MYHIAICDDDRRFISYAEQIIATVTAEENMEIKLYGYSSGEELIGVSTGRIQFDLLILDMDLGGMDGDETAKSFRKKFPHSVLVFCSGIRPPSDKSFKSTPFRYLLKSYTDSKWIKEMREILNEVVNKAAENYIVGHYRNNTIRVKIRNILYVENAKRGSRIIVTPRSGEANFQEQILVGEKLSELTKLFPDLVFAHSSYIVNINHVEYSHGNELLLDTGERLSVSRPYQKSFREAFTRSIANKY